ncbi:hypothetical protein BH11PLA2_BH11PLA2_30740 [soil metagenome]
MRLYAFILSLFVLSTATAAEPTLPRYDLQVKIDTAAHHVDLTQTVTWTNTSKNASKELVLNFYPQYRIPEGDYLLLAKTLEILRLNPSYGIDRNGKAGTINRVTHNGQLLEFHYRHDNLTAVVIDLPTPVEPGQSVTVVLDVQYQLANKQGRWGHWLGTHYLTNALPVVAFHDDSGFRAMPFVPWHQPFFNEAGVYTATITLPKDEQLACSATIKSTQPRDDGTKTIVTEPFIGRDFALLCSKEYKEYTKAVTLASGKVVTLKCMAFEKHAHYANEIMRIVSEALPYYSNWFGDFPYSQLTIAESYFGWNGNECAGLIMIDERVFGSPHLGNGYVEYLVSHETCHQWWYNLIGTNGYAETFMDEGAATYFTHKMLDKKLGKNNAFMNYPQEVSWLPNINRENYRYASMYSAIGKKQMPAAAGELPAFNHLIGLFNGAYDRGSKAFGIIEDRMGETAFQDFTRELFTKYTWKILQAKDLKKELEEYTSKPWDDFFEKWIYGKGVTDWKIETVDVRRPGRPGAFMEPIDGYYGKDRPYQTVIKLKHSGDGPIETTLGIKTVKNSDYSVRVRIDPRVGRIGPTVPDYNNRLEKSQYAEPAISVEPGDGDTVVVTVTSDVEIENVKIDPDNVNLDANPGNNAWKNPPRYSFTPLYTTLNETDLTNDYDRWNFGAGPWIGGAFYSDPWYVKSTMIGARAGAYRTQVFSGGVYGAYRTDYRDLVIGADGLFDHTPLPKSQLGFNVERRVGGPYGDVNGSDSATRASAFARYVLQYGASLYLPPMHYVELFNTYQDNFLPYARTASPGAVRPNWTYLGGIHQRLNLYTPYWDPECGLWWDFVYGAGLAQLNNRDTMHQLRGELAFVKPLFCNNDCMGPIGDTRIAVRGVAMGAVPDQGQFFALGGGTLFRGFDLAERQGSMLWTANVELRMPLVREVEWDTLDHTLGARNVWLATFYDVGAVYNQGRSVGGVAHAVGAGIRVDMAVFSFIERATIRFDVGKTLNAPSPFQFWFGVQHAF